MASTWKSQCVVEISCREGRLHSLLETSAYLRYLTHIKYLELTPPNLALLSRFETHKSSARPGTAQVAMHPQCLNIARSAGNQISPKIGGHIPYATINPSKVYEPSTLFWCSSGPGAYPSIRLGTGRVWASEIPIFVVHLLGFLREGGSREYVTPRFPNAPHYSLRLQKLP